MTRTGFRIAALAVLSHVLAHLAAAQTPLGTTFTYQGRLTDGGQPASGAHDLKFTLYDALTGGNVVGAAVCADNVPLADGLFTVSLDFGSSAFSGDERFLEIQVRADTGLGCANATGFIALTPRQALTATPDALFSRNAGQLDGLDSTAFLQSIPVPLTLSGTSATHIIRGENSSNTGQTSGVAGVSTGTGGGLGVLGQQRGGAGFFPSAGAGVFGTSNSGVGAAGFSNTGDGMYAVTFAASGVTHGLTAESRSTSGIGVKGKTTATSGTTYGLFGQSDSTSGRGVYGQCTASSGATYGLYGESAATGGVGALGHATASSGSTSGLWGQSDSREGRGVYGLASASSGTTYGVYGRSASTEGRGVFGYVSATTGATHGGYFQNPSSDGIGVGGYATATSGTTYGVFGSSASPFGYGVFGTSEDNAGVVGYATGISGTNYGGDFESQSMSGYGVFGLARAASGVTHGGYFESRSTEGIGARGEAIATSGTTHGVYGRSASTDGRGVYGRATATSGNTFGGYFESNSISGYGAYCRNTASGGTIYGLRAYASTSADGYAVYAAGDMGASGAKSFRIDHPFDPENKYLLHYSAESPEVINFYRGTVRLDDAGEAVVELPPYFSTINRHPSYQLTAVGAPMPMLHVSEEISEEALAAGEQTAPGEAAPLCFFRVSGGVAGAKVSWEVKAVRNDLRMRLHGAPVEQDKSGVERGRYQHPEFYGLPAEMGMDPPRSGEALESPVREGADGACVRSPAGGETGLEVEEASDSAILQEGGVQ